MTFMLRFGIKNLKLEDCGLMICIGQANFIDSAKPTYLLKLINQTALS